MSPSIFLSLLVLSASIAASHEIPRLSIPRDSWARTTQYARNESQTFFFKQTLDHFNYNPKSYTTFSQKYIINAKYWGGSTSKSPIFAYLGAEGPVAREIPIVGTLTNFAARFNALVLYVEHRFYGDSVPYGLSLEDALNDPDLRGYFNSAQALADYAAVIIHVKKTYGTDKSPVIVIGGSYGGMLATWFRLKYPHIAFGALASSAPVLLPVNFTPHFGYFEIVTKSFRDMKLILRRFGSNIIFSNGLRDPYSNGGVLEDISDSIRAVYTAKGSHCMDIVTATPIDPEWLRKQRETEARIIEKWIYTYYKDLTA